MEPRRKEECAQRDGRTPTASCDVAVAFPQRHRALHHRWVFLQVPSLPIRPPCHHPHLLSLSASRAPRCKPDLLVFSSTWSDKSWEWGPTMIRLRGATRENRREEKRRDGWIWGEERGVKVGLAALYTADRLLMVFASPRPVRVQGAGSPGCYIKELWVCRGPAQLGGHINWARITQALRYIQPWPHCLFWRRPLYQACSSEEQEEEAEEKEAKWEWDEPMGAENVD